MTRARLLILSAAAAFAAGLLFVNLYTSVVDAPNWGRDIPTSIEITRRYFTEANPGTFFRVASPLNQLLTLAAIIVCWRAGTRVRLLCGLALVAAVATELMTFMFFYPRNAVMLAGPLSDVEAIRNAWSEWSTANWLRSSICAGNVIFDFAALDHCRSNPIVSRTLVWKYR